MGLKENPLHQKARGIAARVWCDPEMQHCVMDHELCEAMAFLIHQVLADNLPEENQT